MIWVIETSGVQLTIVVALHAHIGTAESGLKLVLEIVLPKGLVKTMFVRLTIALNCISHIELLFSLL